MSTNRNPNMRNVGFTFPQRAIGKIAKDLTAAGYTVDYQPTNGSMRATNADQVEVARALKGRMGWLLRADPAVVSTKEL